MTHRFWISAARQLEGQAVRFSAEQTHQIRAVLRLRAGDHVRVFDGLSPRDRLVELAADGERGEVVGECAQAAEPRTRLTAYPALLQRDKFESVLQKLTEVGVAAIAPVITARCLVREPPDDRRLARWRAIVREASEQCGRGVIPSLLPVSTFSNAVASADGMRIVAFEGERYRTLRQALGPRPETVAIFVGPEGGYTPDEIAAATLAGAQVVTLGPRILRTETASPLLAALVLYELGDLSWPAEDQDPPS